MPCHDVTQRNVPLSTRLWEKVDKNGPTPPHRAEYGNCWLRLAYLRHGYSHTYHPFPRRVLAHRIAWELATGDVLTTDDVIGHICDVRHCVRSDEAGTYTVGDIALPRQGHLFKGTHEDNRRDMVEKGRQQFVLGQYVRSGEENPYARLTNAIVREIRSLYAQGGVSQEAIGARFNIDQTAVSRVIRRQTWKHVD